MLKEEDKLTDALIQFIQALPETKREKIARKITPKKKGKASAKKKTSKKTKVEKLVEHFGTLGNRLPKDYKFNREEANER